MMSAPLMPIVAADEAVSEPILLHNQQIDQLSEQGWLLLSNALPQALYVALCQESQTLADYQSAGLVKGGQQQQIRRDQTRWIEAEDAAGGRYLTQLQQLGQQLNQTLFLGIRSVEAHYARYDNGQFYAQHRDNAHGSNLRAISTVLYLNPTWQDDWGGQLRLQDRAGQWQQIWPTANQLVIFDSNLLHEVCPALHTRRSIAGWLRRDGG